MTQSTANQKPVWFITGCSTGFGYDLARHVLESGYPTVVTARKTEDLKKFEGIGNALMLPLDVTDPAQVAAAVNAAREHFGRIDVLVNNAGVGYLGAVEESEEEQVRWMFEVNVFGLGRMVQAVLPEMRERRSGFIVNISSVGGISPFPTLGYYCASKFAVEGLSGSLALEVEPFGVKVMLVEPSGFRTDWAGRSARESAVRIADYAATAGAKRDQLREFSGRQPGDPARAAKAIVQAVESANPPRHLLLGNAAYDLATARLDTMRKDFVAWESVARGADFPKA
ncbi:oxidoreductase [Propionivibrio limicola]|uniref:oxidoreductase n=1 Tax=Propionivibrio limicola TaxID=167645 RepID=UPI0012917209|nr:oxidoreductase [Propionivibrio limicola]